jgi:large subunit ribosomal protein L25
MPIPKSSRSTLNVEKRTILGRKVKSLRRQGKLPANIFGKKIKSQAVSVDYSEFSKLFRKVGETAVVDLELKAGAPRPVLITNVSRHPVTGNYLHADFHQVDLTEKVTAQIPVRLVGEAPAVKDKGAVLVTVISEVEVKALPADLPDHFEVDIANLNEFGDSILIKDLKVPAAVELLAGPEETVVTTQQPKEEIEEKPAAPAEAPAATAEGEAVAPSSPSSEKPAAPPPKTAAS